MEVSRGNAKKACLDTQGAAELQVCVDPVEGDPVLGCCFATRPSPQDLKLRRVVRSHDLRLTWIKAWESCADRQLHSLLPAYLNPVPKHGQDG